MTKETKDKSVEKKAAVQRVVKNNVTQPLDGSKTGMVWDIANRISAEKQRPAFRSEVMETYMAEVEGASRGTCGTQYSKWCAFHNVTPVLKDIKEKDKEKAAAEKAEKIAAKKAEKAAKEAEKKAHRAESDRKAKEQATADKAAELIKQAEAKEKAA